MPTARQVALTKARQVAVAKHACRACGHPYGHHETDECWTNPDGTESIENTCGCARYVPARHSSSEEAYE